jgi:biopolymer transport protein TolR
MHSPSRGSSHGSNGRRGRRTMAEINMVPFIDVMLVLLIIFMVTAPLITPSMIDLPSVGKAAKQPDHVVQVIVGADDTLKLRADGSNSDQAVATIGQLAASVQQAIGGNTHPANTAVIISADKNVRYETVVRVMDTLQRAGIARVGLSVQLAP